MDDKYACPFCDGNTLMIEAVEEAAYEIQCAVCAAVLSSHATREDAENRLGDINAERATERLHNDELARLRAELEQAKSDVERWAGSSGFYSDSLAMANESAKVLQEERDKYAAALVEIRSICTAMMDGWGQTVTVLDKIRKITLDTIKRQPTEPPHRPETFA